MKVEVVVLGFPVPNRPYGLCGRKATMNLNTDSQSSGAVLKWRWLSWASPSLIGLTVSVDAYSNTEEEEVGRVLSEFRSCVKEVDD